MFHLPFIYSFFSLFLPLSHVLYTGNSNKGKGNFEYNAYINIKLFDLLGYFEYMVPFKLPRRKYCPIWNVVSSLG